MVQRRARRPGAWLGLLLITWCSAISAGSVEVITGPNHAHRSLDRAMVRAIFTVRLREWPDGVPVRVFVLPDRDPVHVEFCRELLGTFPYVLRASWDRLVYTGTGIAPEVVPNEREMRRRVETTPGAIGYVSSADRVLGALEAQTRPAKVTGDSR